MPILNAIASKPDDRDYKFLARLAPLPSTDLRVYNRDIEDQGTQGNCTLNAVTNALEIGTQRAGEYENLSIQFGYFNVQNESGLLGQDGAYSLRDALESVRKDGLCLESEWPTTPLNKDVRPNDAAYLSAQGRKIGRYEAVDISKSMIFGTNPQLGIDNINAALAEGMPVMITFAVGRKFPLLTGPLVDQHYYPIDLPDGPQTGNDRIGTHSTLLLGNNDGWRGWINEGSWSRSFGDNGYANIPYTVIRDFSEAWIVRSYKDLNYTDPALYAAQMRLVQMYTAVLGRAPELSGFKWWLNEIRNGADIAGAAQGFLESVESRSRFANNGQVVCDIIYSLTEYANRCEVAAYFVLDLASDNLTVAHVALDGVTADPASVPVAKKRIRQLLGGGVE